MATLLMRSPELADAEKLATANAERAWPHSEKALGHGELEGQHKSSAEGRSRARKGKSGQKKQPQRGLGVAQLEKLRLQEQSKQEAACLASLQSLPSLGFPDHNQNGGMYFRHIKGAISHHLTNGRGSALAFGNGRFGPPDKLAEYLARDGHWHVGKGTMDGDVFRTFMSLASTDHSRSVSLSRHERDPCVSIMLPRRKDDCDLSILSNDPQAVMLGNNGLASSSNVNNSTTDGSPTRRAPRALACVASPPNSSVRKPPFFSSSLLPQGSPFDSHPSNADLGDEKRSSAEADSPNESVPHGVFPMSNNGAIEAGMINAKLLPVFVKAGARAPVFTLTNLHCFESSSGPANVGRLPRESTNVPVVVGVTENCNMPKELSSVQNFPSNPSWSALNKPCGWKQPWHAFHGNSRKLLHSNNLDLNALNDDTEAADKDCGSASVAQGQQIAIEAHGSERITRTVSEDCSPRPLKIRKCGTWDENRSSKEIQLLTGSDHQKSGDFLTLGLSSYPPSPQHEAEVNSQEAIAPKEIKQEDICSKEGHDVLQLLMCNPQQTQQVRSNSPSRSGEFNNGEGPATRTRLSYSFSSLSSGSLTEHFHRQTGRKMEESLDLRLKLAL